MRYLHKNLFGFYTKPWRVVSNKDFDDFFRGVKPLKSRPRVITHTPPVSHPTVFRTAPLADDTSPENTLSTPTKSLTILDYPDRKITRKIQTGKIRIDATLDLHGYSYQKAQDAVNTAVEKSLKAGDRWMLIITGKGVDYSGVLRKNLPLWLSHPHLAPRIISVMPAHQNDGGLGAFYVHLRTKSPHNP